MPGRPTVVLTAAAALGIVTLVACTGSAHQSPSRASSPGGSGTPVACTSASPIRVTKVGAEVRGTGHGATLYGLLMTTRPLPVRAGESVKIVWRMTGSGSLRLTASGPHGRRIGLQWGPDFHTGSDYHRPGQEWGAGYRFPTPGCWDLHARRSTATADVWLHVESRT
jgi:hypothetical protein